MDGFRVVRIDDILGKVDLVIAATGNKHIITRERKSFSFFSRFQFHNLFDFLSSILLIVKSIKIIFLF